MIFKFALDDGELSGDVWGIKRLFVFPGKRGIGKYDDGD